MWKMTKQELEKAIENGESVWCYYVAEKEVEELFVGSNKYKIENDELIIQNDWYYPLKYLFKTKAEAEHYLHHANITRTETLPFLSWEEFNKVGKINFYDKNHCYIEFFINRIEKPYMMRIINHGDNCWDIKDYDYNEENFYKAYDECVKLFKGCEDE